MKQLRPGQRGLKAAQIRNAPDFPVQNLYPCAHGPEPFVFWLVGGLMLTEGILFRSDGYISYAPAMVARMEIKRVNVVASIDGFDEECEYRLRLVYTSKTGEHFEQVSVVLRASDCDRFAFDIPLEHVDRTGWFTCALKVELLTPIPAGPARDDAQSIGCESPHMPVILRGSYLEING
jgi:hypothetical protein